MTRYEPPVHEEPPPSGSFLEGIVEAAMAWADAENAEEAEDAAENLHGAVDCYREHYHRLWAQEHPDPS